MTPAFPSMGALETAALTLVATLVGSRLLPYICWRSTGRFHGNIRTLLRVLVSGLTWTLGISIMLSTLGVPIIAAFGVGVVGAGLAVAAAQLAQGLVGGAWLLIEGDFDVGDRISVSGYEGEIEDMRLRSIIIHVETPATSGGTRHQRVTVPYTELMGGPFSVDVPDAPHRSAEPLPISPEQAEAVQHLLRRLLDRLRI